MKRKVLNPGITVRLRGFDAAAARRFAQELPSALASCQPGTSGIVKVRVARSARPESIARAGARAISGDQE